MIWQDYAIMAIMVLGGFLSVCAVQSEYGHIKWYEGLILMLSWPIPVAIGIVVIIFSKIRQKL